MKTFQVATLILLGSSVSASSIKGRRLQDVNDTAITTDGSIEVPTTVAPGETVTTTVAPEETVTEVSPTEATTAATNTTDGGLFDGVKDWVGDATNTVTGTVANATDGFTDWISNVVNPNGKEEEAAGSEEVTGEGADDGDSDEPGSAGMVRFVTMSALAASTASIIALI